MLRKHVDSIKMKARLEDEMRTTVYDLQYLGVVKKCEHGGIASSGAIELPVTTKYDLWMLEDDDGTKLLLSDRKTGDISYTLRPEDVEDVLGKEGKIVYSLPEKLVDILDDGLAYTTSAVSCGFAIGMLGRTLMDLEESTGRTQSPFGTLAYLAGLTMVLSPYLLKGRVPKHTTYRFPRKAKRVIRKAKQKKVF